MLIYIILGEAKGLVGVIDEKNEILWLEVESRLGLYFIYSNQLFRPSRLHALNIYLFSLKLIC